MKTSHLFLLIAFCAEPTVFTMLKPITDCQQSISKTMLKKLNAASDWVDTKIYKPLTAEQLTEKMFKEYGATRVDKQTNDEIIKILHAIGIDEADHINVFEKSARLLITENHMTAFSIPDRQVMIIPATFSELVQKKLLENKSEFIYPDDLEALELVGTIEHEGLHIHYRDGSTFKSCLVTILPAACACSKTLNYLRRRKCTQYPILIAVCASELAIHITDIIYTRYTENRASTTNTSLEVLQARLDFFQDVKQFKEKRMTRSPFATLGLPGNFDETFPIAKQALSKAYVTNSLFRWLVDFKLDWQHPSPSYSAAKYQKAIEKKLAQEAQ